MDKHEPDVEYWPTCAICHGGVYLDDDERWVHDHPEWQLEKPMKAGMGGDGSNGG